MGLSETNKTQSVIPARVDLRRYRGQISAQMIDTDIGVQDLRSCRLASFHVNKS